MIKKTITYIDSFDGQTRTEDFYFNLTKAELTELEFSIPGGFDSIRKQIEDQLSEGRVVMGALLEAYKLIITKAVGYKSLDGKRFIKNKDYTEAFIASDAYSELIIELLNVENETSITEFFDGVLVGAPMSIKEAAEKMMKDDDKIVPMIEAAKQGDSD